MNNLLTPFESLASFLETRPVKKLNLLQSNPQTQESAVLVLLFNQRYIPHGKPSMELKWGESNSEQSEREGEAPIRLRRMEGATRAPIIETHLILNKRSESVDHHKGQICFPGGVYDSNDTNLWQTALRETKEEIGIDSHQIKYLGRLGQVVTPTNFRINPFVAELLPPFEWKVNSNEIEEIFSVPFSHLLNSQNFKMETNLFFGVEFPDPRFKYQNHEIWGATGRIIVDLLECWKIIFNIGIGEDGFRVSGHRPPTPRCT